MSQQIFLEKQVLEHAYREWEGLSNMGSTFSLQTQRNVRNFSSAKFKFFYPIFL